MRKKFLEHKFFQKNIIQPPKTFFPIVVNTKRNNYSRLSNKRDGWNKCDGRKISQNFGPKKHSPPTNFKFKSVFEIFKLYLT